MTSFWVGIEIYEDKLGQPGDKNNKHLNVLCLSPSFTGIRLTQKTKCNIFNTPNESLLDTLFILSHDFVIGSLRFKSFWFSKGSLCNHKHSFYSNIFFTC